jgi:hypothetical protein
MPHGSFVTSNGLELRSRGLTRQGSEQARQALNRLVEIIALGSEAKPKFGLILALLTVFKQLDDGLTQAIAVEWLDDAQAVVGAEIIGQAWGASDDDRTATAQSFHQGGHSRGIRTRNNRCDHDVGIAV